MRSIEVDKDEVKDVAGKDQCLRKVSRGARNDRIKYVTTNAKSLSNSSRMVRSSSLSDYGFDLNIRQEKEARLQDERTFFAQPSWHGLTDDKKGLESLVTLSPSAYTRMTMPPFLATTRKQPSSEFADMTYSQKLVHHKLC